MRVALVTKSDVDPISIEVRCHETWTAVAHIDAAIKTLRAARAWMLAQKEEAKK